MVQGDHGQSPGGANDGRSHHLKSVTTLDYMSVVSVRFADGSVHQRLKRAAVAESYSLSALAERLIDEGLRMSEHPRIVFRDGASGRRPGVLGGPDVWVVVTTIVGGDVSVEERVSRAAELLSLSVADVDAAMRYYAEFTDEIDADIAARREYLAHAAAQWQRQRDLTAS